MNTVPLVLVVGGDGLAVRVCSELVTKHGHRAANVWMQRRDGVACLRTAAQRARRPRGDHLRARRRLFRVRAEAGSRHRVLLRVQDEALADSIARHFDAIRTVSTAALAAPVLAMISRFRRTRGGIRLADDDYNLAEQPQDQEPQAPSAQDCIALGVWRNDAFLHIDAFGEMKPFDRVLFLVPLSQFKSGRAQNEKPVAAGTT